jgi:hypothetical protein
MLIKRWRSLAVVTSLLAVLSPLTAAPAAEDSVVAVVNGEPIPVQKLEQELVRIHSAQMGEVHAENFSLDRLVQKLINDCLIAQEARGIGLDQDSAVAVPVGDYRESLALDQYLRAAVPDSFPVSDQELRDAYNRDFRWFDIQTISVTDSSRAAQIADSIRAGVSMDTLAVRHSVDNYHRSGGRGGRHRLIASPPDIMPLLENAKVGDILGPVYMWRLRTVMRVNKIEPAEPEGFDSLRIQINYLVQREKTNQFMRELTQKLRDRFPVRVDSVAVDSLLDHMRLGQSPSNHPVITVAGTRRLSEADLRRRYMMHASGHPERDARVMLRETVDAQIRVMLMRAAAVQDNFAQREDVLRQTRRYEDSLLVSVYLEDVVNAGVNVSADEIKDYYNQHKTSFRRPPRVHFATLTRNSAEEAQEDYKKIRSGSDFAWLVKQNSVDDARDKGGLREWVTIDQLPVEIRPIFDTLAIGDVTPPCKLDIGWTIVQLTGRQEGEQESLEQVSPRIRANLQRQRQLDAINSTMQVLRKHASIDIRKDVLKSLQVVGRKDEEKR